MRTPAILIFLFGLAISVCGQSYIYPTLTYEQVDALKSSPNGTYKKYVAKSGEVFAVGDTVTIGRPSTGQVFNYVDFPDAAMFGGEIEASSSWSGRRVKISKIFVAGSKKAGYWAQLKCASGISGLVINIELALEVGEVVGKIPNSDQALAMLKTAKDKLDLGLITQAEYDSLKADLVKHIKTFEAN